MIHAEIPPFSMQINKLTKNFTFDWCSIKQIIFHKINVFCDFYEDACEKLYCMVHCV